MALYRVLGMANLQGMAVCSSVQNNLSRSKTNSVTGNEEGTDGGKQRAEKEVVCTRFPYMEEKLVKTAF